MRIKAAVQDFETETNLSVICEDGSFYAFNVKYATEPEKLNIEMQDFLAPTAGCLPSNRSDIYFKELQVTLYERGGGRTLSFSLDQEDLLLAQKIDKLKLKW